VIIGYVIRGKVSIFNMVYKSYHKKIDLRYNGEIVKRMELSGVRVWREKRSKRTPGGGIQPGIY